MDFVAIDFETATYNSNSACQLAIVQVAGSEFKQENSWLIRPPRLYFSPRNIAVHGIRPKDVRDAPTMADIWPVVSKCLSGKVIIAHNARFDIGVLIESLAAYDIACPNLEFTCTRMLAREAWPGRSRYGLKPLGEWLGIQFKHHDALEDARCCARIALAIADARDQQDLVELEDLLNVKRGTIRHGKVSNAIARNRKRSAFGSARQTTDKWGFPSRRAIKLAGISPHDVVAASAGSFPLASKQIVLLGPLRGLSQEESDLLVQQLGGNVQNNVTPTTHYVVACGTTLESASQTVCEQLASHDLPQGDPSGVRILSERQFRALLPGGKAASW